FLLGLQFIEQRIETQIVFFPERAIALEPFIRFSQGFRLQSAWTLLRFDAHGNQACAFEHFEVLGDRRLAHLERGGEFRNRGFAAGELGQDRATRGVGESGEGGVEALRGRHVYNLVVMIAIWLWRWSQVRSVSRPSLRSKRRAGTHGWAS